MNCIAIDDEPLALDLLKDYIEKIPFLKLERTFTNPIEGLGYLQENKVDLIFLDVELPFINGIEFVKCLQTKPMIIFTTAYEKYALAGYDLEVTDYLIKPIFFERFLKAVNKAYGQNNLNKKGDERTGNIAVKESHSEFIMVKTGYSTLKVNLNDILYIEGLKDYIKIITTEKAILTLNSLKKFQEILPVAKFVRVHRSFIVALPRIDSIQRNRIVIGKTFVPVGENYKNAFKETIASVNQ
jgi:DNA-binding LytR/AlgR family response regulator